MEFIDPHLDPIILWNQKPKIESNFSEAVPIHNREIISPIRILNEVRDDTQYQTNLFGEEDVPRDRKKIDSYQH